MDVALHARLEKGDQRVYILIGHEGSAEGSVWEAARTGVDYGVDNICAIIDVNRLGQSGPTMLQHQMDVHRARWEAFGRGAIETLSSVRPATKPPYQIGGKEVATRKAFGDALQALGKSNSRVVALDRDVKNALRRISRDCAGTIFRRLYRRAEHGWRGHGIRGT